MLRILGKILRHTLIYFFYVSAWCVNIIEGRSVFFVSYYFVFRTFVKRIRFFILDAFQLVVVDSGGHQIFLRFRVYPTFFSSMFSMMAISCILVFTLS